MNKKFWATTFTLTGTIIGAGILGLPYVFAKSGFLVGVGWLILLGTIMILAKLYLGELALRTKKQHQLPGLAEKYLGKKGKKIMFFAMVFGIYSALLAYLIGEGESFSHLIFGHTAYAIYFGFAFWLLMVLLLTKGLAGLKKVETWGVIAIILIVLGIFIWFLPSVNVENLVQTDSSNFFLPFGVILFALLGFVAIPELEKTIKGQEKNLKKAIILGVSIPILLYILFPLIFVGILGNKVEQVATISLGPIVTLLGIFTMFTSYFALSFSLKSMFKEDFKSSNRKTFFWVALFPLLLFLIIKIFNIAGFISILGIGGVISGGLTGILILLMHRKARKHSDMKPEYKMRSNWFIIILLSVIFILGTLTELFF
jgi:tyrosine-specific transport protein